MESDERLPHQVISDIPAALTAPASKVIVFSQPAAAAVRSIRQSLPSQLRRPGSAALIRGTALIFL